MLTGMLTDHPNLDNPSFEIFQMILDDSLTLTSPAILRTLQSYLKTTP